jgi:hypothetical protein
MSAMAWLQQLTELTTVDRATMKLVFRIHVGCVFRRPKIAPIERRHSVVKFAGLAKAFGHDPIVDTHIYSA